MCEQCGAQISQERAGRPRRFCLTCRPRKRPLVDAATRECPECGASFTSSTRVFCSARCRFSRRNKGRRIPCASCGAPIYWSTTSRPRGEARCRECIRSEHGCGTVASYKRGCRCVECRRANAEATRNYLPPAFRHHWISPADRVAIYDRDAWTCQICGVPVDVNVHHLHRLAPSLDHIEPQSLALIPDHRPENLRTAHRGCNSARGNRVSA